jgi:hypothetical protein
MLDLSAWESVRHIDACYPPLGGWGGGRIRGQHRHAKELVPTIKALAWLAVSA